MKHLLLLLPLVAVGCADEYGRGYAAGYAEPPAYPSYAAGYGNDAGYVTRPPVARPYAGGENCGTPESPKACPPLPRHPLPYYPGDRP
ncbi:MAG: hypothetical protein WDN25_30725 [Acetobacteraceae bacterium]